MKFNLTARKAMSVALALTLSLLGPVNRTDKKFLHPKGTKQLFDLKQDLLAVVLFILFGKGISFGTRFRNLILGTKKSGRWFCL